MRIPLFLSVAVIAISLAIGWRDHMRLTAARAELVILVREQESSKTSSSVAKTQDTRRTREEHWKEAALLASGFLDYLVKLDSSKSPSSPLPGADTVEMEKREAELWDRMMLLNASGWHSFMNRVLEADEIPEGIRREAIFRTMGTWISKDPRGALEIIARSSAFFGAPHQGHTLLNTAIHALGKVDPAAAVELVQHPPENLAAHVNERTRMTLIAGIAYKDPALALRLVDEMKLRDRQATILSIAEAPSTAAQKTAVLAAMRERLPALADDKARREISRTILGGLAGSFANGNFGEARQWFESAKLSPEELASCARGLKSSVLRPETGLWIEWFGSRLSPGESRGITSSMMESWAENDHLAAADWLSNKATDGPVRNVAIASYAEAISSYQPEAAATWVLTLPAGKDRDKSLRVIHNNWPSSKAAARDAFAKENGFTWP